LMIQIQLDIRLGKIFFSLIQIILERRNLLFQRLRSGNRGIALFLGGVEVLLGLVERGGGLFQIRRGLGELVVRVIVLAVPLIAFRPSVFDDLFDFDEIKGADSQSSNNGDDKTDSNQHGLGSKVLL